jgi:hypothetical protein
MCVVVSDQALQAVFVGEQFLAPVCSQVCSQKIWLSHFLPDDSFYGIFWIPLIKADLTAVSIYSSNF